METPRSPESCEAEVLTLTPQQPISVSGRCRSTSSSSSSRPEAVTADRLPTPPSSGQWTLASLLPRARLIWLEALADPASLRALQATCQQWRHIVGDNVGDGFKAAESAWSWLCRHHFGQPTTSRLASQQYAKLWRRLLEPGEAIMDRRREEFCLWAAILGTYPSDLELWVLSHGTFLSILLGREPVAVDPEGSFRLAVQLHLYTAVNLPLGETKPMYGESCFARMLHAYGQDGGYAQRPVLHSCEVIASHVEDEGVRKGMLDILEGASGGARGRRQLRRPRSLPAFSTLVQRGADLSAARDGEELGRQIITSLEAAFGADGGSAKAWTE